MVLMGLFNEKTVNQRCIDCILALTKYINATKLFVSEFSEIQQRMRSGNITFTEYPTNSRS